MKYWVLLSLALVLISSGCIQPPTQTCPAHYMKIGSDCCLDDNGNGICDRDEPSTSVCPPQTKTLEDRIKECGRDSSCLTNLAVETNNPNLCTGIIDNARCLEPLATRYSNPAYCNMLSYDFQKEECLAKLGGTNSTCPPPVSCPVCQPINVSVSNQTCPRANLTLTERMEQCKQITYDQDQISCLKALAEETNTPSICYDLLYGRYEDGSCYEELAIKYKNKGYCDQLSGFSQEWCLEKVNDSLN